MDDTDTIFLPMFPLELAAFPGEEVKLHIFEPRYKQLIGECLERGITFGIPPYFDNALSAYGTEMRVEELVHTYDNGEMDIRTLGVRCFRLVEFLPEVRNRLYSGAEVVFLTNEADSEPVLVEELTKLYARLHAVLGTERAMPERGVPDLSFRIAQEAGLQLAQKVQLLALEKESDRQRFLVEHLVRIIPIIEAAEEVKERVRRNGRFQQLPP